MSWLKEKEKTLHLGFSDMEKAYDRVNRNILYWGLEKVGLSDKVVTIIRSMYVDTRAKHRLGNLVASWVRSERGVLQGCIL